MSSRNSIRGVGLNPQAAQPPDRDGCIPETASYTKETKIEVSKPRGTVENVKYHAYTLWLFNASDIPTQMIQTILFGVAGASSGRLTTPPHSTITPPSMAVKLPVVILFIWLLHSLVQFGNQSSPGAPEEDRLNKPWRPIPAGRISREQAHGLVAPFMLLTMAVGFGLDVFPEAALFCAANLVYTQFGGSEALGPRHASNGVFISMGGQASLKIAAWSGTLNATGYAWSVAHFCLVVTTIQAMDFRDQVGDAAIGRQTLPLVMGDAAARWVTLVPMFFWTILCPWLCDSGFLGYTLSAVIASIVVFRLVVHRTADADGRSYKIWGVWLAVIYSLPWLASLP